MCTCFSADSLKRQAESLSLFFLLLVWPIWGPRFLIINAPHGESLYTVFIVGRNFASTGFTRNHFVFAIVGHGLGIDVVGPIILVTVLAECKREQAVPDRAQNDDPGYQERSKSISI